MNLVEKIQALDAKRGALAAALQAQAQLENGAAGEALAALVKINPSAAEALQNERVLSALSKKSRALFASFLIRNKPPAEIKNPTPTHQEGVFVHTNSIE